VKLTAEDMRHKNPYAVAFQRIGQQVGKAQGLLSQTEQQHRRNSELLTQAETACVVLDNIRLSDASASTISTAALALKHAQDVRSYLQHNGQHLSGVEEGMRRVLQLIEDEVQAEAEEGI